MKKDDLYSIRMRASCNGRHISGAEGIYNKKSISGIVREYAERAINHSRGLPDEVNIKIRALKGMPVFIPLLRMITVRNYSIDDAGAFIRRLLLRLHIPDGVVEQSLYIISGEKNMRGAALIDIKSSDRLEPDTDRGIRSTEVGISEESGRLLSERLSPFGLDNNTVREAVVLASKVAYHDSIVAELCVSDNPDYTTGYIAGGAIGYVRIPNIKKAGSDSGGRVFFVKDGADIKELVHYLEETPVMINDISDIKGEVSDSEFFGSIIG